MSASSNAEVVSVTAQDIDDLMKEAWLADFGVLTSEPVVPRQMSTETIRSTTKSLRCGPQNGQVLPYRPGFSHRHMDRNGALQRFCVDDHDDDSNQLPSTANRGPRAASRRAAACRTPADCINMGVLHSGSFIQ